MVLGGTGNKLSTIVNYICFVHAYDYEQLVVATWTIDYTFPVK